MTELVIGAVRETFPGERRVALMPGSVGPLTKAGAKVVIERGAGAAAGFPDGEYEAAGAVLADSRDDVFAQANIITVVRTGGGSSTGEPDDLSGFHAGQTVIGMIDPLSRPTLMRQLAERDVTAFSLELLPRITRAQSMDVLSSMATVAGYKAVLLSADALPRMFPMMMTAAGTLTPAKVLIVGVGVAGLQAIATARRLGAVVSAYDIRPAVKEQVQSLGAKFVELDLEAAGSETAGGYAKQMDEEFYRRQREQMAKVIAAHDVVITTAAVPGKKAPILVTAEMARGMTPGSVIVDVAAERGGNCELTKPGETVVDGGVTILGPDNLPSTVPYHASQMYSRNMTTFLQNLLKDGQPVINLDDEIIRDTLCTRDGEVVNPRVRELLGLPPMQAGDGDEAGDGDATASDAASESTAAQDAAPTGEENS